MREKFGARVYRVPLDAGFTCPNRDGSRARGGCTFCDDRGSGAPTIKTALSVKEQLEQGMSRISHRFRAQKFLAYFQAFSNTYAPVSRLRELYDTALSYPQVVGLCIGTRPDCVPDDVLDLLAEYHQKTFVWLELGLQSAFDETLKRINRGHNAWEFFDAVKRAKKRNLLVAAHLIFGLPGENNFHFMESTRQVAASRVDGIKIHQLCVYKGTPMERDYQAGRLKLLSKTDYVRYVADALELLPPDTVIMRLVAEGTKEEIVAPEWSFYKEQVHKDIEDELLKRRSINKNILVLN